MKEIFEWVLNAILLMILSVVSAGIIFAIFYFPLLWLGMPNGALGVGITAMAIYIVALIIKIFTELI